MSSNRKHNYEQARNYMLKNIKQPLTHDFIKNIHILVVSPDDKRNYRTGIGSPCVAGRYLPPDSLMHSIDGLMDDFILSINNLSLSPIDIAAHTHWGLAKIHPFDDGNGRTARILTCHTLLNYSYAEQQCRLLEDYFATNLTIYSDSLYDGPTYNGFESPSEKWLNYIHNSNI